MALVTLLRGFPSTHKDQDLPPSLLSQVRSGRKCLANASFFLLDRSTHPEREASGPPLPEHAQRQTYSYGKRISSATKHQGTRAVCPLSRTGSRPSPSTGKPFHGHVHFTGHRALPAWGYHGPPLLPKIPSSIPFTHRATVSRLWETLLTI